MELTLETIPSDEGWGIRLRVDLDTREANELFLGGDKLISWPTEGMCSAFGGGPVQRSGMYLSELASRGDGVELVYETSLQADRAAAVMSTQIREVFPDG